MKREELFKGLIAQGEKSGWIKAEAVNTGASSVVSGKKIVLHQSHQVNKVTLSSGYRVINVSEQQKKEGYKQMNRMLGGSNVFRAK